jgi:hypothetical protein
VFGFLWRKNCQNPAYTRMIAVACARRVTLSAINPQPAGIVRMDRGVYAIVWRLLNPAPIAKAEYLAEKAAARVGGSVIPALYSNRRLMAVLAGYSGRGPDCLPVDFLESKKDGITVQESIECLASVAAKNISWLWPQVFAYGKLGLLSGEQGLGKSQIAIGLGAAVSSGTALPASKECASAGNVLMLVSEDATEDTIKPRFEAAGANMRHIFILRASLSLPDDLGALEAAAAKAGNVKLAVLDPFKDYTGGRSPSKTRTVLNAWNVWAAKANAAVIGIRHPVGSSLVRPQKLFSGSAEEIQAVRTAWFTVPDREDSSRTLMLHAKGSTVKDRRGFAYHIESVRTASGIETSRVVWERERVEFTAQEYFMSNPDGGEKRRKPLSGAERTRLWRQRQRRHM